MRFIKLPGLVHILALAVLIAATLPFAGSGASKVHGAHAQITAIAPSDCIMHGPMTVSGTDCSNMTLHCVSVVVQDAARHGTVIPVIVLHHRVVAISATSLAPEAESPPPRA